MLILKQLICSSGQGNQMHRGGWGMPNNNELKVILGVDEQHSWVSERPIVVEAQKNIAALDPNISFTSMIGLPKADATHLTPHGLVEHEKIISEAFKKCEQ
ncbi:MAG: hypothetical protein MI921_25835 [Cytophagales bacterium]|nr:hypothetical protein [Cytophagales bacterium]